MGREIIAWLRENHDQLLVLAGIILVGILAFEAGLIKGEMRQMKPLIVSIPESPAVTEKALPSSKTVLGEKSSNVEPIVSNVLANKNCPLVGSKNSNKFHLITCAVAKRIKPENRVCFLSKEDAERRGYVAGCLK